jgi:hypothetical protein
VDVKMALLCGSKRCLLVAGGGAGRGGTGQQRRAEQDKHVVRHNNGTRNGIAGEGRRDDLDCLTRRKGMESFALPQPRLLLVHYHIVGSKTSGNNSYYYGYYNGERRLSERHGALVAHGDQQ